MEKIKAFIKRHAYLYELINAYRVSYDYGYLRSRGEICGFLKKLKPVDCINEYDPTKKDIFIILGDKNKDSTLRVAVFGDIDEHNCTEECVFYTSHELKNSSLKSFHKLFFKINKVIPLPFKGWWEEKYTTSALDVMEDYNMFVIFLGGTYYEETFSQPNLLRKIHEFSNKTFCKKILYLADPIDKYPNLPCWFPYFDAIASYSLPDQKKYNTVYIDTPCVQYKQLDRKQNTSDIYFRGMDAGRGSIIDECHRFLQSRGVNCNFYIQTTSTAYLSREGISFSNDRVPYKDMVLQELGANVLLEVLIPGVGSGPTLRSKEAVMYGKKLLTNNPWAKELAFYHSGNIQYFQDIHDIDVDWLKNPQISDYCYNGEYSVDCFLKKIKRIFTI